jgi:hypothetical protein
MMALGAVSREPRWRLRDWIAAAGLFLATATVVLWQNAHIAVLWDLSYILDSSFRIALGQVPYRDFPFAHAPLTFLIQAAIIRLTGRVYFHHVLYCALVGGLGTVLTWRIALHTLRERLAAAWTVSVLLAAPLTVLGIYCILPIPSYDCDCCFSILVAVWLLQRPAPAPSTSSEPCNTSATKRQLARGFAAGAALVVPLFFKQNIGLPFLAVTWVLVLVAWAATFIGRTSATSRNPSTPILFSIIAGVTAALLASVLLLHFTAGLGNYFHWTIQFAAQRRMPGLHDMLAVYHDSNLLWTLPCIAIGLLLLRSKLAKSRWAQFAAIGLLAAPFIFTLYSLFVYDDADERGDSLLALWPLLLILASALALWNLRSLRRFTRIGPLLAVVLLVTINGTFMSQQLWGSTYAIWPLLILLIAGMIAYLDSYRLFSPKPHARAKSLAPVMAVVISATLLVCGSFYTASEERLSYVQLPEGPPQHSAFPQLAGMATPGPYLPNFDQLLQFAAANIPASDGLILLPGEDPFYFATGRTPQFPVLLFDPATDPYSPAQLVDLARAHNIRWLIVKHELQINEDVTPQREAALKALLGEFKLSTRLTGYDIYRRQ